VWVGDGNYAGAMKRLLIPAALLALVAVVVASASAGTSNPLTAQLRAQKAKVAKLTRLKAADDKLIVKLNKKLTASSATIATLNKQLGTDAGSTTSPSDSTGTDAATIADLQSQVATLTAQVSQKSQTGLQAVLAGTPDNLWAAIVAIYAKFPTLPVDQICGYDKATDTSPGAPPTATDYTFTLWAGGCS
jgi:hypothetical protein